MNPELDPTLPKAEIKLKGHVYHLVFNFAAIATAEVKLRKLGHDAYLLKAIDFANLDASGIAYLLYAAILPSDPSITYEKALSLITFKNYGKVMEALWKAWQESIAEPDEDDDPKEQPE